MEIMACLAIYLYTREADLTMVKEVGPRNADCIMTMRECKDRLELFKGAPLTTEEEKLQRIEKRYPYGPWIAIVQQCTIKP